MNIKSLLFAASIPLLIGNRTGVKERVTVPKETEMPSSSYALENCHFVDGTSMYQLDVKNLSSNYINASSMLLCFDNDYSKESKPVLGDQNVVIAPQETLTVTFNTQFDEPKTVTPTLSCFGYHINNTKPEYEDTVWVSCTKTNQTTLSKEWSEYKFIKRPFNYSGSNHFVYTVKAGEEEFSFYGGSIQTDYHTFKLDKQYDLSELELKDVSLIEMEVKETGKDDVVGTGILVFFKMAILSYGFLFIFLGVFALAAIAFIIVIIVAIIKSVRKKGKKKQN